jgi:hypothetical protein
MPPEELPTVSIRVLGNWAGAPSIALGSMQCRLVRQPQFKDVLYDMIGE